MTRDEVKDAIHADPFPIYSLLETAKDGKSYICPFCGHGKGGDGITLDQEAAGRFHCFACERSGDGIDLYQRIKGISDFNSALAEVAHLYGLQITPPKAPAEMTDDEKAAFEKQLIYSTIRKAIAERTDARYIEYLKQRGITQPIAEKFKLGFIANWQPPKLIAAGKQTPESPRLIIPTGEYSYLARDIRHDQDLPDSAKNYTKQKAGGVQLFNAGAIRNATRPLFIVEGEFDAISFYEVDANAVALGSAGNVAKFIDAVKSTKPRTREPFIIALDNDDAGRKATARLTAELDALKVRYYIADPDTLYNGEKDANAALVQDRAAFAASVHRAECQELYQRSNAAYLPQLRAEFTINPKPISTGFFHLDGILDGGLLAGLYFIGGVSGSGKTAVCMQIVDQVAKAGGDCIVFAAEMSRADLIARSISRETAETGKDSTQCFSQREVQAGYKYQEYPPARRKALNDAFERYSQYADHITIYENTGDNMKPSKIKSTIARYCSLTGKKPVILIDYLQILTPEDSRQDIRIGMNEIIMAFKEIAVNYRIPVIVISALSRENYTEPLHLSAFKESGGIEYTADYLLGLQFSAIHDIATETANAAKRRALIDAERTKTIRDVEITIIKQRGGVSSGKVLLSYNPRYNFFTEKGDQIQGMTFYTPDENDKKALRQAKTGHLYDPDDAQTTRRSKPL